VQGGWDRQADPLHWAQAKIYGFIYGQANALERVTILLSYLDLDTGEVTEFRNSSSLAELSAFFQEATGVYLAWLRAQHDWCRQRDESIRALEFPFPRYRPGQRELAVAAYRVMASGGRLAVTVAESEAGSSVPPTGVACAEAWFTTLPESRSACVTE